MSSSNAVVQTAAAIEDGSLLELPPPVLVAVLCQLPDVCTLVRSCTACKALYSLLRTNTWQGISALRLPTFHPSLRAAAPWIGASFPHLREVDVSGCAALPEPWLAQLAAGSAAIGHLIVDDVWGWHGQESLPAFAPALQSLSACNTSLPLCSKESSWLDGVGLVHLTSLKLAGLVTSPQRCRTHGSSDCRCWDVTLLGALLHSNPKLGKLDLSDNPKLPTRLLEAALSGDTSASALPTVSCCITALTRLSLRGCTLVEPPMALLQCTQLEELDLSGTSTADRDLRLMLVLLPRLRRLDLSGCVQVSDDGLKMLEDSMVIAHGTLMHLGLGNLPRVRAGQLAALLRTWVVSTHDAWSCAGRVCQRLLQLGVAHNGAVTDEVAQALVAAFTSLAGWHCELEPSSKGAPRIARSACVTPPLGDARHGVAANMTQERPGVTSDADHVGALASSLHDMRLSSPQVLSHSNASDECDRLELHVDMPFAGFEVLDLAGCSKLSGAALAELAACGCFVRLRSLDLSHFEGLRLPANVSLLATAHPAKPALGSGRHLSIGAAQTPSIGMDQPMQPALPALFCSVTPLGCGRHLLQLQLDGCHLTNQASTSIASACPRLEVLSLVGCRGLGDAGIKAFVANCGEMLRGLSIGGASSAWREDVALQGLTALTSLRISRRSHLLDAHLAPVLAANPHLRALTLAGCYSITDAVFAAAPAMLESLRLVACDGVTGEGLQRLRGLRQLALGGCIRLRQEAVQAVVVCCRRLVLLELPAHIGRQCLPRQGHEVGHLQGLKVVEHSAALHPLG